MLVLVVLASSVWVLITLPTLTDVRIVRALTGPEAAQIILGAVFGCILRYWWPDLLAMKIGQSIRCNWRAISLVGVLLLAAAVPDMGSLLRDWGMTSLKTPFAEFQFAFRTGVKPDPLPFFKEENESNAASKVVPDFAQQYKIEPNLAYLNFFPPEKIEKHSKIYQKSISFAKNILAPLANCAYQAYENDLDPESIRHALNPVAQKLRLLIQQAELILVLQSQ